MATSLQFIKSAESSSLVADLSLTDIFTSEYEIYQININYLDSNSDGGYGGIRFIDSGGNPITGSEYDSAGSHLKSYASFDNSWQSVNATSIVPVWVGLNDDNRGGGAVITVFNPNSSSSYTFVNIQSATFDNSGGNGTKSIGVHKVAEQITGIQFLNLSNNASLKIISYGVK